MPTLTPSRRSAAGRSALRWSVRLLGLALAVLVAAAATVLVVLPRVTHGRALTVLSGSMTPGIPVGSVALVRPVDPASLRVGDIATYQAEPDRPVYVTHRVFAIDVVRGQTQFTFKGDANREPDVKPVVAEQIRGELWFHVPYLGGARDELSSGAGRLLLLALLLAGYAANQLVSALGDRGAAAQPETPRGAHRVDA